MLVSTAATLQWVRQTYSHDEEESDRQKVIDVIQMLFFAFATLLNNAQHGFKLDYYLSLFNFIDLLNVRFSSIPCLMN